jgi:hypothetical protein
MKPIILTLMILYTAYIFYVNCTFVNAKEDVSRETIPIEVILYEY